MRPPKDELEDACARWGWAGAAEEYEVDEATIIRWLRESDTIGEEVRGPKPRNWEGAPSTEDIESRMSRLARLYVEHKSSAKVARIEKCAPKTVLRAARAKGVPVPVKRRVKPTCKRKKYDHDRMQELYASGLSTREVADIMECGHGIVANVMRRRGLSRPRGDTPSPRWTAMAYLVDAELMTALEVAALFGSAKTSVYRACESRGVFVRLPRAGERRDLLMSMLRNGEGDKAIARTLGISIGTSERWRAQAERVRHE